MKFKTSTLIFIGIILACIGFRIQNKIPALASFSALIGAFLLLIAARRLGAEKKKLKAAKQNTTSNKKR